MKFKYSNNTWPPYEGDYKKQLVLYKDDWNDYNYVTTFHLVYCDAEGKVNNIGDVKIYEILLDELKKEPEYLKKPVSTSLPDKFDQLNQNYCSLGQSLSYYTNLKNLLPNSYKEILLSLNDIATNNKLKERFINEDGVQTSLLRESSAEKALNEAITLLNTNRLSEKDISFKYKVFIPYSNEPAILKFNFTKDMELPYRINIIVGKNGTGKTQILTMLANSLSGITDVKENRQALFIGNRPPVDKVISISYSAFDSFKRRPGVDAEINNSYLKSYVYCGIQSDQGTLSLNTISDNFRKAYHLIREKKRVKAWESIISEVLEAEHKDLVSQIMNGCVNEIYWSSGQYILVCTITEVLAYIENESIILFDEPEIHLHPNAIANTMRMFYKLLDEFDSYAIFGTHSPLIVQETPSAYIQILERIDNILLARNPEIECFGENIAQIVNEIFDVSSTESNYKTIFKKISARLTYDEIINIFDGKLSLNAMIYLKNCCK